MDDRDLLQQAERLESRIWESSTEDLRALEAALPDRLRAAGFTVREVLFHVSDEGLVLAVQKEFLAKQAFEELLECRYKQLLFRWAAHWGLTIHNAEDLVHTLFFKFLQTRFSSYELHGPNSQNFRAFLWTAARNQWIQDLRKKKPGSLEGQAQPFSREPGPEQVLLDREFTEQVEEAVGQLPDWEQKIMRATLDGRSLNEIAEETGLGYQAVTMRLYRARRKLEQILGLLPRSRAARGSP